MGQVGIITPVTDGRAEELKRLLSALPRDKPPTREGPVTAKPSPFTGVLPPTHFARFVVIKLDHDRPYLLFTSVFDGDTRDYLRALAATEEAQEVWSHCKIADTPTAGELERYLCDERNWRPSQYVVSAVPDGVTVGEINRALSLRAQLAGLITRATARDPTALAHDLRQLPAVQALMSRR
ncbi:MAG: hypothetical protein ACRDPM_20420 [Solirubrobacteraceae bacterium]